MMIAYRWWGIVVVASVMAAVPRDSVAAIMYTFVDGGVFEADGPGDTATLPPDDQSGVEGTITTDQVVQADGTAGGALNENSGVLAVNSITVSDDGSDLDGDEAWTFHWDVDTTLDAIDFTSLTNAETFSIRSPGWINRNYALDTTNVSFDTSTGTFLFADDGAGDRFDLTSLVTGDSLLVSANSPYTIAYGNNGNGAYIESFTFSASATAVPEPGGVAALVGLAAAAGLRRWRQRQGRSEPDSPAST